MNYKTVIEKAMREALDEERSARHIDLAGIVRRVGMNGEPLDTDVRLEIQLGRVNNQEPPLGKRMTFVLNWFLNA